MKSSSKQQIIDASEFILRAQKDRKVAMMMMIIHLGASEKYRSSRSGVLLIVSAETQKIKNLGIFRSQSRHRICRNHIE